MKDPDIAITEPLGTSIEKIRLALKAGRPAGAPSLCDELLEDRSLESERELAEEGW